MVEHTDSAVQLSALRQISSQSQHKERIAVFSKFLLHGFGGAEKSTSKLVQMFCNLFGSDFLLIGTSGALRDAKAKPTSDFPTNLKIKRIELSYRLPISPLWEYLLNRTYLASEGRTLDHDSLWVYGILGPALAKDFRGKTVYFIRSETDLGIFDNYHSRLFYFIYKVKSVLEYVPRDILRSDIKTILARATVVANSNYMAALAKSTFGCEPIVMLPDVDVSSVIEDVEFKNGPRDKIVLAGDGKIKGEKIFCKLAKRFPSESFLIFTRQRSEAKSHKNLEYRPWAKNMTEVYREAKLVLVPSQWREAYGRVAREAYLLGIPILASKIGGLPEALDNDLTLLVENYDDVYEWQYRIIDALDSINAK